MSDRFKFRVWNLHEQCVDHKHIENALIRCSDGCAVYHDGFANMDCEIEDAIIEQCTGLKDCNGQLIYEGDIVKWRVNGVIRVGMVVYEHGWYDLHKSGLLKSIGWDYLRGESEVISNIHENPELLEAAE